MKGYVMNNTVTRTVADPREMAAAASRALESLQTLTEATDEFADALIAYVPLASEFARTLSARQWAEWCSVNAYGGIGALSGQWLGKDGTRAWHALSALLELSVYSAGHRCDRVAVPACDSCDDRDMARALVMAAKGDGAKARKAIMSQARTGDSADALACAIEGWQADGLSLCDAVAELLTFKPAPQKAKAPTKAPAKPAAAHVAPVGRPVPSATSDRVNAALAILRAIDRDAQIITSAEHAALMSVVSSIVTRAKSSVTA